MNQPPKGLSRRFQQQKRPAKARVKPRHPTYIQKGVPCPHCGATDGRCAFVSENTLEEFLSTSYLFSNIDEFKDFLSKNKYITLFDANTLNQHIKIPNCMLGFNKDDNLFVYRLK